MRAIVVGVFAVAMIIFAGGGVSAEAGQGNERAVERRGFETPPGKHARMRPSASTIRLLRIRRFPSLIQGQH